MASVEAQVKQVISRCLGLPEQVIGLDSSFTEELGCEPSDVIRVLQTIEEEFDVEFPDLEDDAEDIQTPRDVINLINMSLEGDDEE